MATDATGTPTSNGIPTYQTNVDAPSGKGFNNAMTAIDTLITSALRTVFAKTGVTVGTRRGLNFIEGTNATITVADNAANDRVDVTITAGANTSTILYDSGFTGAAGASLDTGTMTVPAWVNHMRVEFIGASANVGTLDYLYCQLNGDTAGNYTISDRSNAGINTASTGFRGAYIGGTTITAGYTHSHTWKLPWATQTSYWKRYQQGYIGGDTVNDAAGDPGIFSGVWRNTVAINRLRFYTLSGANFVAGSRILVYGEA